MKPLIASLARFWTFNLASQLARAGSLGALLTGYPRAAMRSHTELLPYSINRPEFGAALKLILTAQNHVPDAWTVKGFELLHRAFSRAVIRYMRAELDCVWGLSSFCADYLVNARTAGMLTLVDHGSLHEKWEKKIMQAECSAFGFTPFGNWRQDWLIERQDYEFATADVVVCCSALAKRSLIAEGVEPHKIHVNQLGVNLSLFTMRAAARPSGTFRAIYVGNLNPRKGIHYLLSAWRNYKNPKAELWLVGSEPVDLVLRKFISEHASGDSRIRIFGAVPESRLPRLYEQCDLFVLPSLADGWAMVVLQAMASGLPVVVTNMTGAAEIVRDGLTGWIIPPCDPEALLNCLEKATSASSDVRFEMGRAARDAVMSGYSWRDYGERAVVLLQKAASAQRNVTRAGS